VDQLLAGRDCRTHDHANLYLAGGKAMPSASIINSMLSKVALSPRFADSVEF
jgi:hypothetical protein